MQFSDSDSLGGLLRNKCHTVYIWAGLCFDAGGMTDLGLWFADE
jgi:hypothetical protein